MFAKLELTTMAHALAAHAAARQATIAGNVAHADTPGYRAREVEDFAGYYRRMQGSPVARLPELRSAPPHALQPNGNSVSLEVEMMRAVEVRHQYDMALGVYRSASSILRTALGR